MITIDIKSKVYGDNKILLSPCDYYLSMLNWHVYQDGNILYAASNVRRRDRKGFKRFRLHRAIMKNESGVIDHANRNGLDNRRENLRVVTTMENGYNRTLSKNNTTGFKGVVFDKRVGRFKAKIKAAGRYYFGGHFNSATDAARKYNEMARELHGEFAYQNPI